MKKHILLATLLAVVLAFPAFSADVIQSKKINITINGVTSHSEYKALVDDLKKVEGIVELIPSYEKAGTLSLTGRLGDNASSVKNDIQALVMDRYKLDSKENKEALNVALKKL